MKTPVLFIVLLFLYSATYSQKFPKVGTVSDEIVRVNVYPDDSSASAYIIGDYGSSRIKYYQNDGFIIEFDRITRIKILKKEGYDWADVEVPLYKSGSDDEDFSSLKAITYNSESNKVVQTKLDKKEYFVEKYDDNHEIIKFTMPNVKEGSVIEYSYRVTSPFLFNLPDWQFEHRIPIKHSEYWVYTPEYYKYKTIGQGYIPLNANKEYVSNGFTVSSKSTNRQSYTPQTQYSNDRIEYEETIYSWSADNVPAFKSEPFTANSNNYITKMSIELAAIDIPGRPYENVMGDWNGLNKSFLDNSYFGELVDRSSFLSKELDLIDLNGKNQLEKINIIIDYVKNKVAWNGSYRKYARNNLKKPFEEGKGSSAEVNLILTSLLRKSGFSADPVLISTRKNGIVNTGFPLSSQFNYVIVAVDIEDNTLLVDATDKFLPFHMLPERCLNGKGWRVSATSPGFVQLNPIEASKTVILSSMNLNTEEGLMQGNITKKFFGYEAYNQRRLLDDSGIEDYTDSETEDLAGVASDFSVNAFEEVTKPCNEKFNLEFDADMDDDYIYIDPLMNEKIEENPFRIEQREYPVDFSYPYEKQVMIQYNLPEGVVVDELPESLAIGLPNNDAEYVYTISHNGNMMIVTSRLKINKPLFLPDEYVVLKEFFAQVVEKQNEIIVLSNE